MWILLNNQPVCVFNIKKRNRDNEYNPEVFYYDTRVSSGGTVSYIYSDAYKLYRQRIEQTLSLITEEDHNNPKDSPAVKAYEKALMGTKHVFGWYFKIQLDGGTTLYSSLYPSEEYAAQIRDSLLQTINKVTAELPKITI